MKTTTVSLATKSVEIAQMLTSLLGKKRLLLTLAATLVCLQTATAMKEPHGTAPHSVEVASTPALHESTSGTAEKGQAGGMPNAQEVVDERPQTAQDKAMMANLNNMIPCPRCSGTGSLNEDVAAVAEAEGEESQTTSTQGQEVECSDCEGTGKYNLDLTYRVKKYVRSHEKKIGGLAALGGIAFAGSTIAAFAELSEVNEDKIIDIDASHLNGAIIGLLFFWIFGMAFILSHFDGRQSYVLVGLVTVSCVLSMTAMTGLVDFDTTAGETLFETYSGWGFLLGLLFFIAALVAVVAFKKFGVCAPAAGAQAI